VNYTVPTLFEYAHVSMSICLAVVYSDLKAM